MGAIHAERPVHAEAAARFKQLRGVVQQRKRACPGSDVQQVDADDGLRCSAQVLAPVMFTHVEGQCSGHGSAESLMADPAVDAAAVFRIGVTALPGETGKALLKGHAVLPRAAGEFQHQTLAGQMALQRVSNGNAVALRGGKQQAFVGGFASHRSAVATAAACFATEREPLQPLLQGT